MRNIPRSRLLVAVGLTFVSYTVLTLYDALGVRYVRRSLSYGRIATAAVVGYGVSMTLGFPCSTGAPLRYRLYSRWGLSPGEIRASSPSTAPPTGWGCWPWAAPRSCSTRAQVPEGFPVGEVWMRPSGALLLGVLATYFVLAALKTRVTIRGFRVELPSLAMSAAQVASSSLDWVVAAGVMSRAAAAPDAPSYTAFFAVYVAGQAAGHASHVPGGLGVLESVVLLFLSPRIPAPQVLGGAAGLARRVLPAAAGVAVATLAVHELRTLRGRVRGVPEPLAGLYAALEPQVLAVAAFVSGAVLLFSAATPLVPARLAALHRFLPLGVIESSHLLGAVCGVGLLLVARGLQMRLSAAWRVAAWLLAAGILASLLKGLDWEEALIVAATLGAVPASRGRFYRGTALRDEPYTPGWLAAIALALVATGGSASSPTSTWTTRPRCGCASRRTPTQRGSCAPARAWAPRCWPPAARDCCAPAAPNPSPRRRRPGRRAPDRRPLASSRREAGAAGRQGADVRPLARVVPDVRRAGAERVAMGDPVGGNGEAGELAWRFREEADRHGAWPVFYQAAAETLPLYLEMGLVLLKLGEEAVVRLDAFSPSDPGRRSLRRARHQAINAGATFEVVDVPAVPALLPELKAVSDEWLARYGGRDERGFAAGRFDPAYLANFPVAVVRVERKAVAFANLWLGAEGTEAAVDLVRLSRAAPPRAMEFLLVEAMLWARARGYRAFSLGMAPLAGAQTQALGERWERLGTRVFRLGEHFADLRRLRRYLEKFGPEWRLRYLAVPPAAPVPRVLDAVAALISGGGEG